MKSFVEAYRYLKNTSAKDIAKRTAIFGAFFNTYCNVNFGHDYLLDIVAALYGPFDTEVISDDELMSMLKEVKYGFHNKWPDLLNIWITYHGNGSKDNTAFVDILQLLSAGKGEEILSEFEYIVKVTRPTAEMYFPELTSGAIFSSSKQWPRI